MYNPPFDLKSEILIQLQGSRLGISVEPAEVRLIPTANDPYTWRKLPGKQHLFAKHLSKQSIGIYRELCREVGVSFEAIPVADTRNAVERNPLDETKKAREGVSSYTISVTNILIRFPPIPKLALPR
jgi:hypothetical protein